MSHSSPEGIELSKGSNLESFSLSINKEKVLELKQQERIYSEEEVWKLVNKLNQTLNIGSDLTLEEWFEQFKKK